MLSSNVQEMGEADLLWVIRLLLLGFPGWRYTCIEPFTLHYTSLTIGFDEEDAIRPGLPGTAVVEWNDGEMRSRPAPSESASLPVSLAGFLHLV